MNVIQYLLAGLFTLLEQATVSVKDRDYRRRFDIHESVRLGRLQDIRFDGKISIGPHSYFNSGRIQSGVDSQVIIGRWCAIGYNVNLLAITHDVLQPTGPNSERPKPEADIVIGDNVWIGSNVYVREGVVIGDYAVVGANAVVTHDVPPYSVIGGVPARIIRQRQPQAA